MWRAVVALVALDVLVACAAPPVSRATSTPAASPAPPLVLPPTAFQPDPAVRGNVDDSGTAPRRLGETRRISDAPAEGPRRFRGAPIDLDVRNADVQEVLRLLADVGHVNIVVASEVSGAVTLKLTHVPWDQALDVVLRVRGLTMERDGTVIIVHAAAAQKG